MKLINIITLYLFFFSNNIIYSQDCNGLISIQVNYEKVEIFFNDSLVAIASTTIELPVGKHQLKIIKSGSEWGSEQIIDTISIVDCGQEISINYQFTESKILKTEPSNVSVYYNENILGYTPLKLQNNYPKLKLIKSGYEELIINNNEITESAIKLNLIEIKDEKLFYEKNLFGILIGTALLLGGTSAYYKIKADDKFEEYKITGNSSVLQLTRDYDLISGITLGALQINFGLLIYFFLVD